MVSKSIKESLSDLPQFMTAQDLVEMRLYQNKANVYLARVRSQAPDCIRIGAKILFPKGAVIDFVLDNLEK